jgi:hypothetical protein
MFRSGSFTLFWDRLGSTNDGVETSIARMAGLEEEPGKGFFVDRDVSLLRNEAPWYILEIIR